MKLLDFSKMAAHMSAREKEHYQEGDLGPGVSKRKITPLPTVKKPKAWDFSAHPHLAEKAGPHIDIRLGNPATGIAHSFVLPKRTELPKPGEMARVIPTFDHSIPYMNYWGEISTRYGKGKVEKGRRTTAEVYHADPSDPPGTKARFNLYEGPNPEEFSIRKDEAGKWFIHNKTQTRARRPDIPSEKPSLKEIDPNDVDPTDDNQAMMPKLDGAHGILDLRAGRAPRLFSYREAKISPTGLIEHTHKIPELLKTKVPKALDRTLARVEIVGIDKDGKAVEPEVIGGLLNSKVWDSRRKQAELGIKLQVFPHGLVQYRGKSMEETPYSEQLKVLKKIENSFEPAWVPELATTPEEKIDLLNRIKAKKHPLTSEGVVLVEPNSPGVPIKAKFNPDFDVYVRAVNPAISGKTGKPHDRAGSISYSWTPDGPVVGQLGGFAHDEARDMLKNPDQYVGRVAKVKARKVFKNGDELGALFQPRFKEWHLDKGEIEKGAMEKVAPYKSDAQRRFFHANRARLEAQGVDVGEWDRATKGKKLPERVKSAMQKESLDPRLTYTLGGAGLGALGGGILGYGTAPTKKDRWSRAIGGGVAGGVTGGLLGLDLGRTVSKIRKFNEAWRNAEQAYRAREATSGARGSSTYNPFGENPFGRDPFRNPFSGGRAGGSTRGDPFARARPPAPKPPWLGDVKTKAEAKAKFREAALKNHPDRGGNENVMKNINAEWDAFQKSPGFQKLARAFLDELKKISSASKEKGKAFSPVGATLGAVGSVAAGNMLGKRLAIPISQSISFTDAPVSGKLVRLLKQEIAPEAQVYRLPHYSTSSSVYVPKGGLYPRHMRGIEEMRYSAMGAPDSVARKAIDVGGVITGRTAPEALSHELGHASLRDPARTGRLLRGLLKARVLAPISPILGGVVAGGADPSNALAMGAAPIIAASGFAPMLTDEALASLRGYRALKRVGGYSPEVLSAMRKTLTKAFGTYGALTAGMTLPVAALAAYRHIKSNRSKTAAAKEGGLLSRLFRQGSKPAVVATPIIKPSISATKMKVAPRRPSLEELKAEYQRGIDKQRLIDVQAGSRPRVSTSRVPAPMSRPAFAKDPIGRQHSAPWD